jgi:hypothetical protein
MVVRYCCHLCLQSPLVLLQVDAPLNAKAEEFYKVPEHHVRGVRCDASGEHPPMPSRTEYHDMELALMRLDTWKQTASEAPREQAA